MKGLVNQSCFYFKVLINSLTDSLAMGEIESICKDIAIGFSIKHADYLLKVYNYEG